jgi:rhodanese-related sulfurtransferase
VPAVESHQKSSPSKPFYLEPVAWEALFILDYFQKAFMLFAERMSQGDAMLRKASSIFFLYAIMLLLNAPAARASFPEELTAAQAAEMIAANRSNPDFVLLDVRTAEEFIVQRLAGAVWLDFNSPNFSLLVSQLDKNKSYLLYCRSGRRSAAALQTMKQLGFRKVSQLKDGIIGWLAENRPVVGLGITN